MYKYLLLSRFFFLIIFHILLVTPVIYFLKWKLYLLRNYPIIFHILQVTRKNNRCVHVSLYIHVSLIPAVKEIVCNLTRSRAIMMEKHANIHKIIDETTEMSEWYRTPLSRESNIILFKHVLSLTSGAVRTSDVRGADSGPDLFEKRARASSLSPSGPGNWGPATAIPRRTSVVPPGHT